MSMVFTWVYLRTGRSLFSALLLHTAINTSFSLFPPFEPVTGGNQLTMTYLLILYAILCMLLLVLDRPFWKKKG
jgi:membrane protease YdiL (CAAX protease family)